MKPRYWTRLGFAVVAPLLGCLPLPAAQAVPSSFTIGGHIPNWVVHYDPAVNAPITAQQSEAMPHFEAVTQQFADRAFQMVIPGAITWDRCEPQPGQVDFRLFDGPMAWAREHHKPVIVQHLFWEDARTIPQWAKNLTDSELRLAMDRRLGYVAKHIGNPKGLTVINEMLYYRYFRDRFGDGVVKDVFDKARAAFPSTTLYLDENPWQHDPAPIQTGMARLAKLVNTLKSQHVPFDKVGIQLYITNQDVERLGGPAMAVRELKEAFDTFKSATGCKLTMLEFGFTCQDEAYKAQFIKQLIAMVRSDSNVEGFFFYHWLDEQVPNNALVKIDGTVTRAGMVVLDNTY